MTTHSEIATWLHLTVCYLVDTPDRVKIEEVGQGDGVLFRVYVAPREIGQVIGKSGRIARSIRMILTAGAIRNNSHYSLDIVDESVMPA
jgi:uncharacterized protein